MKLNTIKYWLLTNPFWSTTLIALGLAFLWIIVWFLVLLILTWVTKSSTAGGVLVGGLLLSTVAEAIIRVLENCRVAKKYTTGDTNATKSQRPISWAFALFFFGIVVMFVFADSYDASKDLTFQLATDANGGLMKMFPEWIKLFVGSKFMMLSFFVCLGLRTYIYKKDHKTKLWKETVSRLKSNTGGAS